MLITLEDEIKKDRDNDTYQRRDRRGPYRNRKQEGYNHSYQDGYKRNYPQRVLIKIVRKTTKTAFPLNNDSDQW